MVLPHFRHATLVPLRCDNGGLKSRQNTWTAIASVLGKVGDNPDRNYGSNPHEQQEFHAFILTRHFGFCIAFVHSKGFFVL